ncbi:MAG: hypothetical protein QOD93_3006 [Acetobacteraceae bacterium]|nr:hypothetical protein [Acetobacteraceae bacterium]
MSHAGPWATDPGQAYRPDGQRIARALRSGGPALLFGLRLWIAVALALYVAYWLELDNAYWAGTTAAIVCQPSLGASLRKSSFRMIGTVVGAVAIVVLTASFPQSRTGFLMGLAAWGAACGLMATLLRNFASYAAALAGYTAVIIASDELGATGGATGEVFTLAVSRASEICIGIVCAGMVLAATDFGQARRRLAAQFAALSAEITGGLAGTFLLAGPVGEKTQPVRRDLLRRVIALDPVIDEAIGETSELRYRSRRLRAAVEGLFTALSGWRMIANHLGRLPEEERRQEADVVQRRIPDELRSAPVQDDATRWTTDPVRLRRVCRDAVRALAALPADTPSLRLLADATAEVLIGISRTLNSLVLLTGSGQSTPQARVARLHVPDLLPALVNAARVFVVIGIVEVYWIATAWPNGASAVTWAAIFVILYSPTADQAYANARGRLIGIFPTAALAAIVKFAVLPGSETFVGLAIAMGLVLIPAGALSTLPWQASLFGTVASWFIPFIAPVNQAVYDTQQFYNSTLAIVVGAGAATLAFRLLPPLSPALRTRRLLALTLRDLRRLATAPVLPARGSWESKVYGRLSALPEQAEPVQRAQLLAALSVGTEIIRLRRVARRIHLGVGLDVALEPLARGQSVLAAERLARVYDALAIVPGAGLRASVTLRAQGSIRGIAEALAQHAAYFDSESSW